MKYGKRNLMTLVAWVLLILGCAAEAFAAGLGHRFPPVANTVPELDPGVAVSGLLLISGGVLLLVERYRRR